MASDRAPDRPAGRPRRGLAFILFTCFFAALIFAPHAPLLDLPFFWDELGYFVPAALDLFERGLWVPQSTPSNVHPPLIPIYLSAVWTVAGYSVESTRMAMLAAASLLAMCSFLLAIRLSRGVPGAPAFAASAFLLASPLFFTQAMMAQLDMPASLLTCAVLLLFLDERTGWAAALSVALVLVKETGVIVPLVLGAVLAYERGVRQAARFLAAPLALAGWLAYVAVQTGHPLGDAEFARYNAVWSLHPARVLLGLARRLYYLFAAECRWAGALAILWAARRTELFRRREWRVAGILAAAHVVAVSLFGGAHLERYLLPVLPPTYAAMGAAFAYCPRLWRAIGLVVLSIGLIAGHFWNPPYPFPYENNFSMVRTVRLHQSTAAYLETYFPGKEIVTAWPLSEALREERFGYVWGGLRVKNVPDFRPDSLQGLKRGAVEVFVLYSRDWDPSWNLIRLPWVRAVFATWLGYQPAIARSDVMRRWRLASVMRWESGGQWVEVFVREDLAAGGAGRRL